MSTKLSRFVRCVLGAFLALSIFFVTAMAQETTTTSGKIETSVDAEADRRIEERLEQTYASLEALKGVEVEVRAGVVSLSGTVVAREDEELAVTLAERVDGVVAVQDGVVLSRSIRMRLHSIQEQLTEKLWSWVAAIPLLLIAILIVAAFVGIARWVARIDRLFDWISDNVFLRDLGRQVLQAIIIGAGVLLALEILDATALVGAVLGAAGVVGLAIGFAFRDLVENYIASILLSLRQPFAPNDHVRIDGVDGKVTRLTSRATILLTLDGNHVRIPNSAVFKGTITNFTRKPERRFDFQIGIANEVDIVVAETLALEVLRSIGGVMKDPGPTVLVKALGDSTVTLTLLAWVDQRQSSFGKVKSEAIRLVKEAFDEAGLEMPEPIHRVRVERMPKKADALPAEHRVTPARSTPPESHIDDEVRAERAEEGQDLLRGDAPKE